MDGDGEVSRSLFAFGCQDETGEQMFNTHSLHWLKCRFSWLPNVRLVSKWIYLFYQLLALPCTHCLREAIEGADN